MSHNEKKLANIIEELTMFFFSVGAKDICSGIHVDDRSAEIEFTSDYQPEYGEKLYRRPWGEQPASYGGHDGR